MGRGSNKRGEGVEFGKGKEKVGGTKQSKAYENTKYNEIMIYERNLSPSSSVMKSDKSNVSFTFLKLTIRSDRIS